MRLSEEYKRVLGDEINCHLYKGYIPLNGKKPIISPDEFISSPYDVIEKYPKADGIGGVLADNVMYMDFDSHNMETSEEDSKNMDVALNIITSEKLECIVRRTRTGLHALFLDKLGKVTSSKKETFVACGLRAEYKARNNRCFEPLICEGESRQIVYSGSGVIGQIPSFFLPVDKNSNFMSMREGDGRNSILFGYIPYLMYCGMTKEDIKKCIRIINKYIFEEPLPSSEMELILRDGAFPKELFYEEKRFSHNRFGDYLINDLNIRKVDGTVYVFNGTHYVPDRTSSYLEERMITLIPSLVSNKREETKKYIRIKTPDMYLKPDKRYICFKNGLYNIETGELEKHSPDVFITNIVPHVYNNAAQSESMNKALDDWSNNDKEIRLLLEEVIGISFWNSTDFQKMFILYGDKCNGKSTFLKVLETVIGRENVCNLQLNEMGERFSVSRLLSKLVNIGDDLSDKEIDSDAVSRTKKIVSGESIEAEFKGQDKFSFSPYATLLFSANVIPYARDDTGAFARRVVIIPFDNYFSADNKKGMDSSFSESDLEYFIKVGIEGLRRALNNDRLTESNRVKVLNEQLLTHLDSVRAFVESIGDVESLVYQSSIETFKKYTRFCKDMDTQSVSRTTFQNEVLERYKLRIESRKIGDKSIKVYVRR